MNKVGMALMFFIVAHSLLAEQVALNFKVLDEKGLPIEGARVVTVVETEESRSRWHGSPKHDRYVAITDSSGEAVSRVKSHDGDFRVYLTAEGYYEESDTTNRFAASYDMMQKHYVFSEKEKSLMYVLRKVKNPIKMKTSHSLKWRIPLKQGVYPFDLEIGDWVAPRGKGRTTDLEIVYNQAEVTETNKICSGLLRFPCGGAYVRAKHNSRSFPSDYEAKTNEVYVAEFPFEYYFDKTGNSKHVGKNILKDSQYFVFRVREKRDNEGNVVSANYGKIYGQLKTFGCLFFEKGFFNPTPNDTNIEELR